MFLCFIKNVKMFPCSAFLEGEYNLSDLCIGVPVILGKRGIEKIVEIAIERKTGARALRSVIEEIMLDIMYDIPSLKNLKS